MSNAIQRLVEAWKPGGADHITIGLHQKKPWAKADLLLPGRITSSYRLSFWSKIVWEHNAPCSCHAFNQLPTTTPALHQ
jgi:hypothetical protein